MRDRPQATGGMVRGRIGTETYLQISLELVEPGLELGIEVGHGRRQLQPASTDREGLGDGGSRELASERQCPRDGRIRMDLGVDGTVGRIWQGHLSAKKPQKPLPKFPCPPIESRDVRPPGIFQSGYYYQVLFLQVSTYE